MILYNGATGGMGRYLEPTLRERGLTAIALKARLESRDELRRELASLPSCGTEALLLQLAARVSVPACEADPEGAYRTNVTHVRETVLAFVEWAESRGLRPRVLYVSSGHVYAGTSRGSRILERAATAPRSVYARSKLAAEQELRDHAAHRGFGLLIARVFGLVGPRQPQHYVLPGLIRRVRERALRGIPGLSFVRDYLDARDVCHNLVALGALESSSAWSGDAVNICSGEGVELRDVLRLAVRALRPEDEGELMAEAIEAPGRPDDVPWIVGDPSRFVALTSLEPRRIPLEHTIRDAIAAG